MVGYVWYENLTQTFRPCLPQFLQGRARNCEIWLGFFGVQAQNTAGNRRVFKV